MNTQLKTLFKVYDIRKKDRHEIKQIFSLLSPEKRINFLNNFSVLADKIHKIQDDLYQEREILIWESLQRIRTAVAEVK